VKKDVFTRPFRPDQIKMRKAHGGRSVPYIQTHAVVERLNEAADFAWSFEVLQHHVLEEEVVVLGRLTIDGVSKAAFGGSMITRDSDGRDVSRADDLKAAASSALKKAASLFGIGLDVHAVDAVVPLQPVQPPAPAPEDRLTSRQLAALQSVARRRGWSDLHLTALVDERFKRNNPAALTRSEASSLISELTANGH
jgi:hypothetical protein